MDNGKINNMIEKLSKSRFRNSFHLKEKDKKYVQDKGLEKIESHARDFITKRLAPKTIPNDGRQTPMKGHPVFIAEHATATCCRGCLEKWHKIPKNRCLTKDEIDYIITIIMAWIKKEMNTK